MRRELSPGLFWFAGGVIIGLPIASLILFGLACWRRSKLFAFTGLGAIGLIALAVLAVKLIGLVRRWLT